MKPSGYSGTPLAKKLGIKPGYIIRLVRAPEHYLDLFADLPQPLTFSTSKKGSKNLIHYFTKKHSELLKDLVSMRTEIEPDGMIWVSWPKKSSGVSTDITEDTIRNMALANGLVDVKVCAVDEVWSGLKLVIHSKTEKQNNKHHAHRPKRESSLRGSNMELEY